MPTTTLLMPIITLQMPIATLKMFITAFKNAYNNNKNLQKRESKYNIYCSYSVPLICTSKAVRMSRANYKRLR